MTLEDFSRHRENWKSNLQWQSYELWKPFWSLKSHEIILNSILLLLNLPLETWQQKLNFLLTKDIISRWFDFLPYLSFFSPTGDSIFTAGKPAILTNNTLIRGSKALNNRRPITSSSSTISSQSTNNETGRADKDRKDKTLKDSVHQRYLMDSGN